MKSIAKQSAFSAACFLQGFNGMLQPTRSRWKGIDIAAQRARQILALVLTVLIVPMGQGALLFAQSAPPPPPQGQYALPPPGQAEAQGQGDLQNQGGPEDQAGPQDQSGPPPDQSAPQSEPMTAEELGQLVAPIALYPDALVAQVLAASTYPSEVVQANRWIQAQGNVPEAQIAASANAQDWDPSVKALVAFPSVLAQMDKNIQWTTELGNAYYNQPNDVMSAIQTMRGRAQAAGTLQNTPQQQVSEEDDNIVIAPTDPTVVYVPIYNPWDVYGAPIGMYPGYYYGPPAGVYFGTGIGFGVGIGIGVFAGWNWGWHSWRPNWRNRYVWYRGSRYYTRSRSVYNRGFNRPGGPHGYVGRGTDNRGSGGGFNRGASPNRNPNVNRNPNLNRGNGGFDRRSSPSGGFRPNTGVRRGGGGARPGGGGRSGGGHGGGRGR